MSKGTEILNMYDLNLLLEFDKWLSNMANIPYDIDKSKNVMKLFMNSRKPIKQNNKDERQTSLLDQEGVN